MHLKFFQHKIKTSQRKHSIFMRDFPPAQMTRWVLIINGMPLMGCTVLQQGSKDSPDINRGKLLHIEHFGIPFLRSIGKLLFWNLSLIAATVVVTQICRVIGN